MGPGIPYTDFSTPQFSCGCWLGATLQARRTSEAHAAPWGWLEDVCRPIGKKMLGKKMAAAQAWFVIKVD